MSSECQNTALVPAYQSAATVWVRPIAALQICLVVVVVIGTLLFSIVHVTSHVVHT